MKLIKVSRTAEQQWAGLDFTKMGIEQIERFKEVNPEMYLLLFIYLDRFFREFEKEKKMESQKVT